MLSRHEQLLNQVNKDFKTLFQEEAQKNGAVQIEYRVIDSSGPAHRQIFTSVLLLNGQEIAQGQGRSKKAAEMQAAERGHQKLLSKNKKSK